MLGDGVFFADVFFGTMTAGTTSLESIRSFLAAVQDFQLAEIGLHPGAHHGGGEHGEGEEQPVEPVPLARTRSCDGVSVAVTASRDERVRRGGKILRGHNACCVRKPTAGSVTPCPA